MQNLRFMSWRRFSFNEVNDWAPSQRMNLNYLRPIVTYSLSYTSFFSDNTLTIDTRFNGHELYLSVCKLKYVAKGGVFSKNSPNKFFGRIFWILDASDRLFRTSNIQKTLPKRQKYDLTIVLYSLYSDDIHMNHIIDQISG